MAASAFYTSSEQYRIWIKRRKIYCDKAKLKFHLTQTLNYDENDVAKIIQQIAGHIEKYSLSYIWRSAGWMKLSTEAIRVLLHSLEHSQLICLLRYQDENEFTALHWCADHENNE